MRFLYDVPAPAKLNLFLHVIGRRPDGYHLLQTAFRFIDFQDTLDFERLDDGRILRAGATLPGLAPEQDLVVRAARCLQQATGTSYGARIACHKQIPAGAGLGGGSSDAASTLLALNRLWGTGLKRADLLRLALTLGADVPVFVFGQSAFAGGIGADLVPLVLPPRAYGLVLPPWPIATADVFSDPDLTRNTESVRISVFADWLTEHHGLFGRNDLQAVVYGRHPQWRSLYLALQAAGGRFRMTGSGSGLFAEYPDLATAQVQHDRIVSKIRPGRAVFQSRVCRGLQDHPLRGWVD
ncbi:4-(cytidine 5'-diphospho)-2-C-methyl-D-erythritol kinase [Castellaniella sp.]|uniref:4-(cytidine 5'-diphospho)-2-C-methyl-D-erythritol kinase n=1 Tax=Castellaniella sp. TaxID=1955812 RepID=UPI0035657798